jgi:cystine transport system substrate-binding protein
MATTRSRTLSGRQLALITLGVLALLGAACGPAPATTTQTGSRASAAPSETAAPGLLGAVRARGTLRVANTQASPPWNFLDERNQVTGYDVDVANEIAKRLKVGKVEFIGSNFQNFIPGIQTDKFDIVIAGQTVTAERKLQVDFSKPYQVNGVSIFVNTGNTSIASKDDLAGKRIAVSAGSTQEALARTIPGAEVKTYENATLALTDVGLGRADAYLGSRFVGAYLAEKNALRVKATPGLLNSEINAMSVKKGETVFVAAVDAALDTMIADGTLTAISKKWLGGLDMVEELKKVP